MYSTRETGFYWVKAKANRNSEIAIWEVMHWYKGSNCFVRCDSHTPVDRDTINKVGERLNPPED